MKYSVLMSVYKNDDPDFLKIALESIYDQQTRKPDEVVVVFDGPLNNRLYAVLDEFKKGREEVVKYFPREVNRGHCEDGQEAQSDEPHHSVHQEECADEGGWVPDAVSVGGLPAVAEYDYSWLKLANINETMVYVRVDNVFDSKRGLKERIIGWSKLQDIMLENGMINRTEIIHHCWS